MGAERWRRSPAQPPSFFPSRPLTLAGEASELPAGPSSSPLRFPPRPETPPRPPPLPARPRSPNMSPMSARWSPLLGPPPRSQDIDESRAPPPPPPAPGGGFGALGLFPERKSSQLGLLPPGGSGPAEEVPEGFDTARTSACGADADMEDAAQNGVTAVMAMEAGRGSVRRGMEITHPSSRGPTAPSTRRRRCRALANPARRSSGPAGAVVGAGSARRRLETPRRDPDYRRLTQDPTPASCPAAGSSACCCCTAVCRKSCCWRSAWASQSRRRCLRPATRRSPGGSLPGAG
ncbi:hypothetical protein HYPSUDRAFT_288823 [Hypholoma sublateritium FD-334 SS-4]|uniref:Uncharacterized protein n=1 Tax=Hypholoma sublateritium (strain FD-334 SS-4) TaxID=945553 RepID=A0A0D2KPI0_HYPSF|nr:hypothetical protein HYPSUDRAFT_288823 [Hypholoma sublateritium FD-334 SS-4]